MAKQPVMRRFWSASGLVLGKYVQWVLIVVALITAALVAFGATKLEFATSQDSYLNSDEQIAIDNEQYQELFGGQAMVTLWTARGDRTAADFFTEANIAELERVEARLRSSERFTSVVSPITALTWTERLVTPRDPETGELVVDAQGDPVYTTPAAVLTSAASEMLLGASDRAAAAGDSASAATRSASSLETLGRLAAASANGTSLDNPEWVEFLLVDNEGLIRKSLRPFFPTPPGVEPTLENATNAQMLVRLDGNLAIDEEGEDARFVEEVLEGTTWDGFSRVTTGAPILLDDLNNYLRGGMATLGAIAVVIMLVVLWAVFRVRWRLLSLLVVLLGVVWAFSILGLIGIPLAIVTISGLPILIGIGVDFAIQVHNRVEEEVVLDKEAHPMSETLVNLAPALITATIAGVVAFLALQISEVPMIRDFGVLLAIGIVCSLVLAIVVVTAVLGMREYVSRTKTLAPPSHIERWVPKLGSLPPRSAIAFAVLAVAVLVAGVLLEGRFKIQTDPERWVNQDTQVIRDLDRLRSETGSSSELGYFVIFGEEDAFTDEHAALMTDFARDALEEYPGGLLTASSLPTTVAFLLDVPDAAELPPTGDDLRAAFELAPPDIQRAVLARDGATANLVYRTGESSLEGRRDIVRGLDEYLDDALSDQSSVRVTESGLAVVGIGLLENLEANRAALTYLALGFVALWLLLRLRSLTQAVLAMVPVFLAVGVSSLVVALVGIELSPLTTVSGPLVAAAVSEFAVLILARYLEERRNGREPEDASHHASSRTGRAFVASALTTIGGFAVLIFSALPLLRDFGVIVTLNVAVALVVALVVMPPMLVYADRRRFLRVHVEDGARPAALRTDLEARRPSR